MDDTTMLGAPPEMPGGSGGGTPPDMPSDSSGGSGGGSSSGSSSSSISYSAATSITSAGSYSDQTYTSSTADENAVLITASGNVVLTNATVTKSGDSDGGDNCNFYGINSAIVAKDGSTVSIVGGTVTASATGANGIFSYGGNGGTNGGEGALASVRGDGTTVYVSNATIRTTGDNAGGIMTTGGGTTVAQNLTITTTGRSSAPIRTDRGGGTVSVTGGTYTSSGLGSPAVYSTAAITVQNASLTSNLSEGVCIEGQNSVALTNCTLTANNTQTNGNAQFLDGVMIYQSMSGDADSGTSTFTMTGGTLINKSGHVFHVTNTNAVINLNNVTIDDSGDGILLSVCDDGWSGASNVATLNASGQTLDGDILVGNDSTLTLNLTNGATFTGAIDGSITNASGTSISTSVGTVNVSLDASSKWYLEADTYITSFSGTAANVITGNYNLYVNNVALDGTTSSDSSDTSGDSSGTITDGGGSSGGSSSDGGSSSGGSSSDGGSSSSGSSSDGGSSSGSSDTTSGGSSSDTTPSSGVSINNTVASTLLTGTNYADTIANTGAGVTINALGGNDSIDNREGRNVSINAGDGNDTIHNEHAYYPTIRGGAGNDSIRIDKGDHQFIDAGAGNDTIYGGPIEETPDWRLGGYATALGGAGNDYFDTGYADSSSLSGGAGNDTIIMSGDNATVNGGAGDDQITIEDDGNHVNNILITYANGDGNDVIRGFDDNDTLSISGGDYTSQTSGSNLIITVGEGSITLQGAATLSTVNIVSGSEVVTVNPLNINNTVSNTLITGTNLNDTIANTGARVTIQALAGNDSISNSAANASINADTGDDYIFNSGASVNVDADKGNDTIVGGGKDSTLDGGAGLNLIRIQGGNDDGSYIVLDGITTVEGFRTGFVDTVYVTGDAPACDFKADGLTLYYNTGDASTLKFTDIKTTAQLNLYYAAWNQLNTNVFIADDEWYKVTDGEADYYVGATAKLNHGIDFSGVSKSLDVTLNTDYAASTDFWINNIHSIKGGDGSTKITGSDKADTIIAGSGSTTINALGGNDQISLGSANALVKYASGNGFDTVNGFGENSTLEVAGNYSSLKNGNDVIVYVGNGSVTLKDAAELSKLNVTVSGGESDEKLLTVSNMAKSPIIIGADVETVDASGRVLPVEIFGNGLDNSIVGGINDDILAGGEGNDTLTGGKGKNIFVYTAGNDVITDYKSGKDSILFASGYTSATLVGSDVVFTTTDGALTVTNAAGKELDVDGEKIFVGTSAGAETLTVNNQSKSPVELGSATKSVDASKRITRVEIIGNDLDNTINGGMNDDTLTGGAGNDSILGNAGNDSILGDAGNDELHGGSGNDTLSGGAGNDSLWGDKGRDTFIYESGDDVIFGFDNRDLLETGGDFSAELDGDNLKLTVGNGSIMLKEFTATSFNINGESYVISEGNFVKK